MTPPAKGPGRPSFCLERGLRRWARTRTIGIQGNVSLGARESQPFHIIQQRIYVPVRNWFATLLLRDEDSGQILPLERLQHRFGGIGEGHFEPLEDDVQIRLDLIVARDNGRPRLFDEHGVHATEATSGRAA